MGFFDNLSNKIKQAMSDLAEKFQEVMKGNKDTHPPSAKEYSKITAKPNALNDEEFSLSGNDSEKRASFFSDKINEAKPEIPKEVAAKMPVIVEGNAIAGTSPDASPVVNKGNAGKAR